MSSELDTLEARLREGEFLYPEEALPVLERLFELAQEALVLLTDRFTMDQLEPPSVAMLPEWTRRYTAWCKRYYEMYPLTEPLTSTESDDGEGSGR